MEFAAWCESQVVAHSQSQCCNTALQLVLLLRQSVCPWANPSWMCMQSHYTAWPNDPLPWIITTTPSGYLIMLGIWFKFRKAPTHINWKYIAGCWVQGSWWCCRFDLNWVCFSSLDGCSTRGIKAVKRIEKCFSKNSKDINDNHEPKPSMENYFMVILSPRCILSR